MSPKLNQKLNSSNDQISQLKDFLTSNEASKSKGLIHKNSLTEAIINIFTEKGKEGILAYIMRYNNKILKHFSEEYLESLYEILGITSTERIIYEIRSKQEDVMLIPSWFIDLEKPIKKRILI